MPNPQQNEMEQVRKEIDILQDRLKKNKISQNQFKNGLMHRKNTSKQRAKGGSFSNQKITKYS